MISPQWNTLHGTEKHMFVMSASVWVKSSNKILSLCWQHSSLLLITDIMRLLQWNTLCSSTKKRNTKTSGSDLINLILHSISSRSLSGESWKYCQFYKLLTVIGQWPMGCIEAFSNLPLWRHSMDSLQVCGSKSLLLLLRCAALCCLKAGLRFNRALPARRPH